jgi:hypothetical protein
MSRLQPGEYNRSEANRMNLLYLISEDDPNKNYDNTRRGRGSSDVRQPDMEVADLWDLRPAGPQTRGPMSRWGTSEDPNPTRRI